MALKTEPFDVADYLTDEETISAYLTEALESDDPRDISRAVGNVARARGGMTQLAKMTGLSREALYRALGEAGNPEFGTMIKVMHALGIKLSAEVVA